MDIYNRLPEDIQRKMFIYFRHPVAQQLHDYPWIIPQIINNWPPPLTTEYRIALAKMVENPTIHRTICCVQCGKPLPLDDQDNKFESLLRDGCGLTLMSVDGNACFSKKSWGKSTFLSVICGCLQTKL